MRFLCSTLLLPTISWKFPLEKAKIPFHVWKTFLRSQKTNRTKPSTVPLFLLLTLSFAGKMPSESLQRLRLVSRDYGSLELYFHLGAVLHLSSSFLSSSHDLSPHHLLPPQYLPLLSQTWSLLVSKTSSTIHTTFNDCNHIVITAIFSMSVWHLVTTTDIAHTQVSPAHPPLVLSTHCNLSLGQSESQSLLSSDNINYIEIVLSLKKIGTLLIKTVATCLYKFQEQFDATTISHLEFRKDAL